jgi:uncharacterized protein YdaU (DUF1376 family)
MAEFPALPLWTDAITGDTYHLTPAQFGAYMRLLICAWRSPDCSIPNDDTILGRFIGDPKSWSRLKPVVMAFWTLGKDSRYRQMRLLDERNWCATKRLQQRAAGRASALKRLNRGSTTVRTTVPTPIPTPTPTKKERKISKYPKTIVPDTWEPNPSHYELGKQKGKSRGDVEQEAFKMRNWSTGGPNLRSNWDSVFNNWLINNFNNGNGHGQGRPRPLQDDSLSASRAAGRLVDAAKRGEFSFAPRPSLFPAKSPDGLLLLPEGRSSKP